MGKNLFRSRTLTGGVREGALICAVVACCAIAAMPAAAQVQDERTILVRGEVTMPMPSSRGWSGEAGASGHPLMTPQAILAAASNFQNCVAQLWPAGPPRGGAGGACQA